MADGVDVAGERAGGQRAGKRTLGVIISCRCHEVKCESGGQYVILGEMEKL